MHLGTQTPTGPAIVEPASAHNAYYYTPVLERTTNTAPVSGVQYLCHPGPV